MTKDYLKEEKRQPAAPKKGINTVSFADRMRSYRHHPGSFFWARAAASTRRHGIGQHLPEQFRIELE